MKASRILFTGLAIMAAQFTSSAAVVNLTLENPGTLTYQQTQNSPCVIGESSCNNPAGFVQGDIPNGNPSTYDVSSTYTVAQIRNIVGNTFIVGIDVNSTTKPAATEQLDLFSVTLSSGDSFIYNPASPGTILQVNNQGNGYSDDLLKTIDLTAYAATDTVTFRAIVNNATDGKEQFFLINSTTTAPVPEPTSVLLFGTVLAGVGFWLRKRVGANI